MFKLSQSTIPLIAALSCLSVNAMALDKPTGRMVIAPTCLVKQINSNNYHLVSTTNNFALLQVKSKGLEQLIEARATAAGKQCGGFIDVTADYQTNQETSKLKVSDFLKDQLKPVDNKPTQKYAIHHRKDVNALLKQVNPDKMWANLTTLTNFKDRYANSDLGVEAAKWLQDQVKAIAKENNREVEVRYVETGGYQQPSVVVKLGTSDEPGIVIGGHMDTLSSFWSKKPGADDDGSGSVTVLEVARTILSSGITFKKPIYFIWYAAEEEGLVGSGYVVNDFKAKNIPVAAVMQFDMTGYAHKNDPTMWLLSDYVDKDLTSYVEKLIKTYVKQPVDYTRCGYACSDHASWNRKGYASAMPFEASFGTDNPDIHSERDTMDKLSLTHMTDYAKLGVAYVVELAEPNSK